MWFYLSEGGSEDVLGLGGRSEQQDEGGLLDQGDDADEDEGGDEEGADGVGHLEVQVLYEQGGDDHPHTAHGVSQYMEEHTWNTPQAGARVMSTWQCVSYEVETCPGLLKLSWASQHFDWTINMT